MKPKLIPLFEKSEDNMWSDVRIIVEQISNENIKKLEDGMVHSLKMESKDVQDKLNELQVYIVDAIRSTIIERTSFVNSIMENKFIQLFRYDKNGMPRKWKANEDLSKPYFFAKEQAEKVLDLFSYIRISESDDELSFVATNPATGKKMLIDEPEDKVIDQSKILFGLSQRMSMYEAFQNMAEATFIRAQQEQAAVTVHAKTPLWLLILIAAVSFNDLSTWVSSPVKLTILLMVIVFVFALTKFGYSQYIDSALSYVGSLSLTSVIYLIKDMPFIKYFVPKPQKPTRARRNKKKEGTHADKKGHKISLSQSMFLPSEKNKIETSSDSAMLLIQRQANAIKKALQAHKIDEDN